MANQTGPVIEMTSDGAFIEKPKPTLGMILARLAAFCVALCVAAVAFWAALFLLPFLLLLGIGGYFAFRSQMRRQGGAAFRRRY